MTITRTAGSAAASASAADSADIIASDSALRDFGAFRVRRRMPPSPMSASTRVSLSGADASVIARSKPE